MKTSLEPSPKLRFLDEDGQSYPEWEERKLGEVAKMYQPKTISSSDLDTEGYPVYGAGGIIGYYREYNHEESEVVMVCRGAGVGKVRFTLSKSWITGNSMVISPLSVDDLAKSYLRFCLSTIDPKVISDGSAQPQITRRGIQNLPISLPSLPEQEKIGEFLSALDTEVEQAERLVSLLSDRKKAYAQRIFDRTLRFHDDNDNPYPEWESRKLGDIAGYVSTRTMDNIPHITVERIQKDYTGIDLSHLEQSDKSAIQALPGDVLLGNIRPYLKKTAFVNSIMKADSDVLVIRGKDNFLPSFVYRVIANDRFIEYVMINAKGTKMPRGDKSSIMAYPVSLPSLPEQEKIGSFLSALDDEIDEAKCELGLLKERKKAYAQKIFGV